MHMSLKFEHYQGSPLVDFIFCTLNDDTITRIMDICISSLDIFISSHDLISCATWLAVVSLELDQRYYSGLIPE